jgi:DNA gyrase/topoisomerase IV subunit A
VPQGPYDRLPDVRDGLTRIERVILYVLHEAKQEYGERYVPTALLYGRVVEHVNISVEEFQRTLARLVGGPTRGA